jgi:hypothetical protein
MPNAIKYNTSAETLALKKGNFWIGNGSVGKGPTSSTGFYNGITPPTGGYTIYLNKANNGPSIYVASNDAQLIVLTNQIAGQSYTTVNQCFTYYYSQTDKVCVSQDYPSDFPYIVLDGLVLYLDAGITLSYPGNGTTWTDVNGLGPKNNATLINGPTYNSANGGSIVFDGSDDYGKIPYSNLWNYNNNISLEAWVMVTSTSSNYLGIFGAFDNRSAYNGFNLSSASGSNKLAFLVGNLSASAYYVQQNDTYSLNTWYHLVGVINNGTSILYVNGVLQNDSTTMTVSSPIGPFMIGKFYEDENNYLFPGKIAVGRFYNKVLNQTEVLQNYNAQKSRFGL